MPAGQSSFLRTLDEPHAIESSIQVDSPGVVLRTRLPAHILAQIRIVPCIWTRVSMKEERRRILLGKFLLMRHAFSCLQIPTFAEMFDQLRNKKANAFAVIYGYFLARVASRLTVLPGEEFRIAYEEALACGASIKLGDRPIQVNWCFDPWLVESV